MRATILLAVWALVATGCQCGKQSAELPAAPQAEAEEAPRPRLRELLDEEGIVRDSGETYGALAIPVGLEMGHHEEFLRTYTTHIPVEALLKFFGPKLVTGQVDEIHGGFVYKNAMVRGVETSPFKLDVAVQDVGRGRARVSIKRIPTTVAPRKNLPKPQVQNDYWKTLR